MASSPNTHKHQAVLSYFWVNPWEQVESGGVRGATPNPDDQDLPQFLQQTLLLFAAGLLKVFSVRKWLSEISFRVSLVTIKHQ